MIETKNLTKVYNPKRTPYTAINDVSLSLEEGKSIAMMGKSGSGKSTLMHLLAGLDSPSSGEIYIDGANLATMSNRELNIFRNIHRWCQFGYDEQSRAEYLPKPFGGVCFSGVLRYAV